MADMRSPIIVDLDTGAGVHLAPGVSLQISASGGPVEAKGQKVMASSIPIVVASDQTAIPVSIGATVTVDTELPSAAVLADATANPTVPSVGVYNMGYNGATWDRLRSTTANGLAVDVTRVTGTVTVDSELPAAAALTDAFANPTAPGVGAFLMGWNSATWDRLKSTTANGLVVDVSRVQGNVAVTIAATVAVDTELPAAAALADAAANPTTPTVGAALLGWNTATWDRLRSTTANGLAVDVTRVTSTVTVDALDFPAAAAASDAFANPTTTNTMSMNMGWNGATWDRLKSTTANGLAVDVTRVQGTVTVDSELSVAAALSDAFANPTAGGVGAFAMGYNGATWDRLRVANTGRLQVDVITGGATPSPTSPTTTYVTSASVAAGATANLDTGELGAVKCSGIEWWSSVAYKVAVYRILNTVPDTNPTFVGGGQAFQSCQWKPPHPSYFAITASAGVDGYRTIFTNLDDANAADAYATYHTEV